MLNLKKQANELKIGELKISNCPICSSYVSHLYFMQDADTKESSRWYSCKCGVVYQDKLPDKVYDKKYWDSYDKYDSKIADAFKYVVKIYSPMIEELVYGRRVLMIGKTTGHQEEEFKRRGWVPTTIDKNEHSSPHIIADFEEHDFSGSPKFNLVWLNQTLECFSDPLMALSKITNLLAEDGIIFIGTPDADFVHTRGSAGFIHWKPSMHYLMWNKDSLTNHLEKLGYNVIMARQNYEHRFPAWDDLHLIAQKRFF